MTNKRKVFYSSGSEIRNLPIGTEYILDGIPRIKQCNERDEYAEPQEHDAYCHECSQHDDCDECNNTN